MAERLRSTTRARLSMCWSARPVLVDEFGLPIHHNPFLKRVHPGERGAFPAADNASFIRALVEAGRKEFDLLKRSRS